MTKPTRPAEATARRHEIESYIESRRDQLGELADALGRALLLVAPAAHVETMRAARRRLSEELQEGLAALRILWSEELGGDDGPTWAAALKQFDGAYGGFPDLSDEQDRSLFFPLFETDVVKRAGAAIRAAAPIDDPHERTARS